MKSIVIPLLVMFQTIGLINESRYDKKLIGSWEMKYVSMGYEEMENGVYKNQINGIVGTTTLSINDDKTAALNYPNDISHSFEWNTNKKTITLTPKDENYIDKFFNGTYSYKFNSKRELSLSQEKMTIYLIKKK